MSKKPSTDSICLDVTDVTVQVWLSVILNRCSERATKEAMRWADAGERATDIEGSLWAAAQGQYYLHAAKHLLDLSNQLTAAADATLKEQAAEGKAK